MSRVEQQLGPGSAQANQSREQYAQGSREGRGFAPPSGFARAALILGIFALILAAMPVIGIVLGVLAVIFGVVALVKRQPRTMSTIGLVLGGIGAIISLTLTITFASFTGQFLESFQETAQSGSESSPGVADGSVGSGTDQGGTDRGGADHGGADGGAGGAETGGADASAWAPDQHIDWFDVDPAGWPESAHAGTAEDPHPVGTRFAIEGWDVIVNFIDPDAEDSIRALAPRNPAAAEGERYVLMNVTMKNPTDEPRSLTSLQIHYDTPKQLYSANPSNGYRVVTPEPALQLEDRLVTGAYSGYIAIVTDDVDGELLRFRSSDRIEEIYVAVE